MSKKGGKAQPKAQPKEQSYDFRDIVLAKVRGFPPWPGMIVDPDSVPANVAGERPNAKSKKGTWYCVRFFPAGDYAWLVPKDISKLQTHEIQAYIAEPFKRSGDLLQGYKIALDPTPWEEDREAARVEAAEEEANAEIDQLDSDGEAEADEEDEEDKKTKTKKRKRDSDVPAKKSKAKSKSAEPASKKKAAGGKGRKNGIKSKETIESEDEGAGDDDDAGPSKKTSPPPTKKPRRGGEKDADEEDPALSQDKEAIKVREWRHKLQKAFLNNKSSPKEEDMPHLNELFDSIEAYDGMTVQYLSFSKIGKVMRHINALGNDKVPRDDEFKFRERAKELVDKWHHMLGKPNGDSASAKAATNGASPSAKETNGTKAKSPGKDGMDVDAKGEDADAAAGSADGAAEDAPAEKDDADAPAAADESALADVTMDEP